MKHSLMAALFTVALIASGQAGAGDDMFNRKVGEVHGMVNLCGMGGTSGILVYIPGRSFMARTDDHGEFRLSFVPTGAYRLEFEQAGAPVGRSDHVPVRNNRVTELGSVNVCAVCPANYDPVCGVDGKTYPNACEAQRAGINIAHAGACA